MQWPLLYTRDSLFKPTCIARTLANIQDGELCNNSWQLKALIIVAKLFIWKISGDPVCVSATFPMSIQFVIISKSVARHHPRKTMLFRNFFILKWLIHVICLFKSCLLFCVKIDWLKKLDQLSWEKSCSSGLNWPFSIYSPENIRTPNFRGCRTRPVAWNELMKS